MAKSSLGKAVSRVGAAGGGRTYRKARPGGYYGVLGLIVLLGLASISYSRYERTHPYVASTAFPAVGSTGYMGVAVDVCGTRLPNLAPGTFSGTAFYQEADDIIFAAPTSAAEAGTSHMTLAAFLKAAKGVTISSSSLTVPANKAAKVKAHTYTAGSACPAGTPDAGKKAYPVIATWKSAAQLTPSLGTSTSIELTQGELITFAFLPTNATPFQPSGQTVKTLLNDVSEAEQTTTTTTLPSGSTSTTAPSNTTTTALIGTTSTTTSTTTPVTTTTKG